MERQRTVGEVEAEAYPEPKLGMGEGVKWKQVTALRWTYF